jgi:hypothetical protein
MNPTSTLVIDTHELAASVSREEYHRLLQLPRTMDLQGELRELAVRARTWYAKHGKPFVAWREVEVKKIHTPLIHLSEGIEFDSVRLAERLLAGEAPSVILLAATAGSEVSDEVSKRWSEERPDEAFFLDRFAVAVTEQLIRWSAVTLCRQSEALQTTLLPHLSPGCGNWDIRDQHKLMDLLSPGKKEIGPIHMMDTGALHPQYSVMAVLGVTRRKITASPKDICRSCDLSPCAFRRASFAPLPQNL